MTGIDEPGLHGKLPGYADFITRRLPREFVDPWDTWLQTTIAGARTELGEQWLEAYLTSPVWSFVLQAGVCGPNAWAGVLMPSVDRVGRYFPLTLAIAIPATAIPGEVATRCGAWFQRAAELALSSLEQLERAIEEFDAAVQGLGSPIDTELADRPPIQKPDAGFPGGMVLPFSPDSGLASPLAALAHRLIEDRLGPYSLWWSSGSDLVPAVLLVAPRLPAPEASTALFDGRFDPGHWLALQPAHSAPPDLLEAPL